MSPEPIRFDDGAAYERYMGLWSRRVGETFIDWLALPPGLRWLDVGCGNGAFTELIAERCAPAALHGVDPSEAQLRYACSRPVARLAQFAPGDAMALPFADARFDVAVMPLVIFFVPEPSRGVAEMRRVVRSGGTVCAYGWDLLGGGFPYEAVHSQMLQQGLEVSTPPSPEASQIEVLLALWNDAGLRDVEVTIISVQRTYADFDDYWQTVLGSPSAGRQIAALSPERREALRQGVRERLDARPGASITCSARAHAIKGCV